jgi:hypothetical protein
LPHARLTLLVSAHQQSGDTSTVGVWLPFTWMASACVPGPLRSDLVTKLNRTCRPLAPEDIVRGQHVIVLAELDEFFVPCLDDALCGGKFEVARVRSLPVCLEPLEVVAICLPLVVARSVHGELRYLDVRRHNLGQLPKKAGRRLVRRLRDVTRKAKRSAKTR